MTRETSLDALWNADVPRNPAFDDESLAGLPPAAQRYLRHAIAPGSSLASAVRLVMHGEIKLDGWHPFRAEQVIRSGRGFLWRASTRVHGIPVWGADRYVDGVGAMKWKALGLIPVMTGEGPDVSRSAAGRARIESIWLPSVLARCDVRWRGDETDAAHVDADVAVGDEHGELALRVAPDGALRSVSMQRWGNPEGGAFHEASFGGVVEREATFEGFTIPTTLRIGWYFGTPRFESEGEFFRCEVESATYR